MTTVLLQTLLLRRPKKPEVKEWSAVGVIGMCFPIVCCMSFLLFCVILQCIYFYLFARPKRQLERLRMHVWYSTQDRGSSFGKHRPIRCGTCCAEAFLALHVCICTVCLRCRACIDRYIDNRSVYAIYSYVCFSWCTQYSRRYIYIYASADILIFNHSVICSVFSLQARLWRARCSGF